MIRTKTTLLFALGILAFAASAEAKLKALIIDGQNNHSVWPKSTIMMKQYLEATGLFEVDVDRTRFTWNGEKREGKWLPLANVGATEDLPDSKPDPSFKPSFGDYDVVISNFGNNAADWPVETQRAFEVYVRNGGGFVSVHAANNSFGQWEEYNKIIGIGGWGGRKPHNGSHIFYDNAGKLVRDDAPNGKSGGHGKRHEFHITLRESAHPITRGLPKKWLTSEDECYATLRGPAENMTILATGKDRSENAPTDRHEPMLMVIDYGKGRVFHTTLGHDTAALEGVGFIATFLRGAEWAASGKVTQAIPKDFPTVEKIATRRFSVSK
ncbi:MAG: ThuA domain-containing protein [Opitutales bacterium]|jgi:type 1 glutamine amidotransferase|nr:ThuA domain-containing protein [Opitutales bacterium]